MKHGYHLFFLFHLLAHRSTVVFQAPTLQCFPGVLGSVFKKAHLMGSVSTSTQFCFSGGEIVNNLMHM